MAYERKFKIGKPILEVNNISLSFGGVKAITDTSFNVLEHEIRAIIGPNGAGKSSMLNCINGIYKPQVGSVTYKGEEIQKVTPNIMAQKGISRTFQNLALFKRMSVLDNILVGRKLHTTSNFMEVALQLPKAKREEKVNRDRCEEIVEFLEIEDIKNTPVGKLPYGLQKKVELGRALATDANLILLDEPMAGMNVEEKREMCRFILKVNDEIGTTMVLIEHDMGVVMDISDRVVVLDYGKVIGDGTPDEVRANQRVIDAYLGRTLVMADQILFFIEVVVGGLLAGTMYSLVALGFVLIYKASATFNFSQGAMVFFAVLAFVGFMQDFNVPFVLAFFLAIFLMIIVGLCTERLVLRPLMNQSEDTLLMATIGLGYVLEGLAQAMWGVEVRRLDLGIKDFPIPWIADNLKLFISAIDLTAGIVAFGMIIGLTLLFKYTKMGLGLRAVADDAGAASSIGIL